MIIKGYAALFNAADLSGDVVALGAFDQCFNRRKPRDIKMLYQHDATRPIGVWHKIKTDKRGLWVEGEIEEATHLGHDTAILIRKSAIDGLSIGFRAKRAKRNQNRQRKLMEIDLLEISLVTFPMQPRARLVLRSQEAFSHSCQKLMIQLRQA